MRRGLFYHDAVSKDLLEVVLLSRRIREFGWQVITPCSLPRLMIRVDVLAIFGSLELWSPFVTTVPRIFDGEVVIEFSFSPPAAVIHLLQVPFAL